MLFFAKVLELLYAVEIKVAEQSGTVGEMKNADFSFFARADHLNIAGVLYGAVLRLGLSKWVCIFLGLRGVGLIWAAEPM